MGILDQTISSPCSRLAEKPRNGERIVKILQCVSAAATKLGRVTRWCNGEPHSQVTFLSTAHKCPRGECCSRTGC